MGQLLVGIYHERYPQGVPPSHTMFAKVIQRLLESGTFTDNRDDCGFPRRRRIPNFKEDVLHRVEETSSTHIRTIARDMGVHHSTVCEVLYEQKLHPYNLKRVPAMSPADFALSDNFCLWFLHRCVEEPQFPRQTLFTDECRFTRYAVLNSRNSRVCDDGNPHAQHANGFQQRFDINVWAGIVEGRFIGPYIHPPRITGHTSFFFLQEVLGDLLDNRQRLGFQQDAALRLS